MALEIPAAIRDFFPKKKKETQKKKASHRTILKATKIKPVIRLYDEHTGSYVYTENEDFRVLKMYLTHKPILESSKTFTIVGRSALGEVVIRPSRKSRNSISSHCCNFKYATGITVTGQSIYDYEFPKREYVTVRLSIYEDKLPPLFSLKQVRNKGE